MATVEMLLLAILSASLSGSSPFLAQAILRNRYRRKKHWEQCGLESLRIDPELPESTHFLEYIRWAIPLQAVSQELVDAASSYIPLRGGKDTPALETAKITMTPLPTAVEIKQQYELNSALSLSMPTLTAACAICGLTIVLITAETGSSALVTGILAIILAACLVMVLTDLAARLIPSCITLVLVASGVALQLANSSSMFSIALSMVCGSVFLGTCLIMNRITRRSAIGGGDSKALFSLPLATGVTGLLPALLVMLVSLTGTLILGITRRGKKAFGKRIPLAPYIALAVTTGSIWQVV